MSDRTGIQPNAIGSMPQTDRVDPHDAAVRRGDCQFSEFGWGAGLEPREFRSKDPAEGGRYRARVQDRAAARAPGGTRIR
jgi:hypothetical protein